MPVVRMPVVHVAVRMPVVRVPVVRVPVVRMRLMERGDPGLRLIAVGHPMLRAGLNGSARSDAEEEGRNDGVRIRSDAQSPFPGDADALSRTVSSHGQI